MSAGFLSIPADHPALAGHFPGDPLAPGALILDAVLREARGRGFQVTHLPRVKFSAPLRPDTPCRILLFECPGGLEFQVITPTLTIARGNLACRAADPSENP